MNTWCRLAVHDPDGILVAAWNLAGAGRPDLSVVDRLARLHLLVARGGGQVVLSEISRDLDELLELVGLCREMGGQAEGREEPLAVEEAVKPDDPAL